MEVDIQLIIVIIIGVVVAWIVARKLYTFFFKKEKSSHCSGCSAGDVASNKTQKSKVTEK